MKIQPLSTDNLNSLVALVLELWPECYYDDELEAYQQLLKSTYEYCLLVMEEDIYIAFIHLSVRSSYVEGSEGGPVGYIEALYVKPAYQQRGIGKMLVAAAEDWARQKNCKQLASDTECSNVSSIRFHLQAGFEEVNRVVCFIKEVK
jgi:aminoglycoside 6'-N-acetyltransferase I